MRAARAPCYARRMTDTRLDAWTRGWRGPLLAALVALIAGLPGVFAVPPLDRDESRFAQATAQMLETGDFVTINYQDQPRDKKPVGIHWLQAASVSAFSSVEARQIWAYRIPSLLGAMLAAAAAAWGAAAFFGARSGFMAGAVLGACFILSTEAFIAKTDAVLCGATTLAMAAFGRMYAASSGLGAFGWRTRALFWAGVALAMIDKGPVGPMVVVLAGLALWAWDRKAPWARTMGWSWGLILVAAVVLPWATAITVATDGAFWTGAVGGDLAPKLAGGHESHGAPPGLHLLLSPVLLFPATVLLPAALVFGWRQRATPGVRFALCWLIPTWLVFEALPTKLVHYTLPAYGALAWLAAGALTQPLGRWSRWIGAALSLLVGGALGAATFSLTSQFGGPADLAPAAVTGALFIAAGLIGAAAALRRAAGPALLVGGVVGVAAHGALAAGLAPRLKPLWLSQEVARALDKADLNPRDGLTPGPVAVAGYAEPSLVFQLGTRTGLDGAQEAVDALADGRPAVVESRDEAAFQAALKAEGVQAQPAGVVKGKDYSNNQTMTLTLYKATGEADDQPVAAPSPPAPPQQRKAKP